VIAPKANNAASKSHMTMSAMADVRVAARFASRVCGESAGTGLSVTERDNHTAALDWAAGVRARPSYVQRSASEGLAYRVLDVRITRMTGPQRDP